MNECPRCKGSCIDPRWNQPCDECNGCGSVSCHHQWRYDERRDVFWCTVRGCTALEDPDTGDPIHPALEAVRNVFRTH